MTESSSERARLDALKAEVMRQMRMAHLDMGLASGLLDQADALWRDANDRLAKSLQMMDALSLAQDALDAIPKVEVSDPGEDIDW